MKKKRETFTRLDAAAEDLLRGLARGDDALVWIRARWSRIVGEPLAHKVEPANLSGRRLTLRLLDPAWRKPVEATLRELEAKLAFEVPAVKPKVVLKP